MHSFSIEFDTLGLSTITIKTGQMHCASALTVLGAALPALEDLQARLQVVHRDVVTRRDDVSHRVMDLFNGTLEREDEDDDAEDATAAQAAPDRG